MLLFYLDSLAAKEDGSCFQNYVTFTVKSNFYLFNQAPYHCIFCFLLKEGTVCFLHILRLGREAGERIREGGWHSSCPRGSAAHSGRREGGRGGWCHSFAAQQCQTPTAGVSQRSDIKLPYHTHSAPPQTHLKRQKKKSLIWLLL